MQTKYSWIKISTEKLKENKINTVWCDRCDTVLIDTIGRIRTREPIWEYRFKDSGKVYGYVHESCAYGIEIEGIEANTSDDNYGKSPDEWI